MREEEGLDKILDRVIVSGQKRAAMIVMEMPRFKFFGIGELHFLQ